jgi:hypothetical protein
MKRRHYQTVMQQKYPFGAGYSPASGQPLPNDNLGELRARRLHLYFAAES